MPDSGIDHYEHPPIPFPWIIFVYGNDAARRKYYDSITDPLLGGYSAIETNEPGDRLF